MQSKPSPLKCIHPFVFTGSLGLIAEILSFQLWQGEIPGIAFFVGTALAMIAMISLEQLVCRLGRSAPGKNFVGEVLVTQWRSETSRFHGTYRYKWVASFSAQYMAYTLDHIGDVFPDFGIHFRVRDLAAYLARQDPEAPTTA